MVRIDQTYETKSISSVPEKTQALVDPDPWLLSSQALSMTVSVVDILSSNSRKALDTS